MAWNIYPTNTPVGSWQGLTCEEAQEYQHAEWLNLLHQSLLHSFRCSGGEFTKGTGDSLDIPSGTYIIDGRVVYVDAADNLVITSARPTYLYARLIKTGSLVTSGEYYSNTTTTLPSDPHVIIGEINTFNGEANTCTITPTFPGVNSGSFNWDGENDVSVFLGYQPSQVGISYKYWGSTDKALITANGIYMVRVGNITITFTTFGFTVVGYGAAYSSETLSWTAWV